jgi:hypothetical protein
MALHLLLIFSDRQMHTLPRSAIIYGLQAKSRFFLKQLEPHHFLVKMACPVIGQKEP